MKVIAINGSPRPEGNTYLLIKRIFSILEKEGVETELIQIGNKGLRGCVACFKCKDNKDKKCVIKDDIINPAIEKMSNADAIILGSPTYWSGMTPDLKAFIDRCGLVSKANGDLFKRKPGAAVIAVRRGGAVCALDAINHFFNANEMFTVGSCYWNFAIGREIGEVLKDEEGMRTMDHIAENILWFLKNTSGK